MLVDGWIAAMGHPLDKCVCNAGDALLNWGNVLKIQEGWNPAIPSVSFGPNQTTDRTSRRM